MSKYQLILLGHGDEEQLRKSFSAVQKRLIETVADLGISASALSIISRVDEVTIDQRLPAVLVYFGLSAGTPVEVDGIAAAVNASIPVVPDLSRFSESVPSILCDINGMSLTDCGDDYERLVSLILENFGLLRLERRVFISYRRVETRKIAGQLYETLDGAGFQVFLDTNGVRPGERFQDTLWHHLADSDVVVLLDSPEYMRSKWTEAELAKANTSNIQILQITWPSEGPTAEAAFSVFHKLEVGSFKRGIVIGDEAELRQEELVRIVDEVESVRARAYAARHNFLTKEFVREVQEVGAVVAVQPDRTIVVTGMESEKLYVVPVIGVPNAVRYESIERTTKSLTHSDDKIRCAYLLYDDNGIRDQWLGHLDWLDENIVAVKGLRLRNAFNWLNEKMHGKAE